MGTSVREMAKTAINFGGDQHLLVPVGEELVFFGHSFHLTAVAELVAIHGESGNQQREGPGRESAGEAQILFEASQMSDGLAASDQPEVLRHRRGGRVAVARIEFTGAEKHLIQLEQQIRSRIGIRTGGCW